MRARHPGRLTRTYTQSGSERAPVKKESAQAPVEPAALSPVGHASCLPGRPRQTALRLEATRARGPFRRSFTYESLPELPLGQVTEEPRHLRYQLVRRLTTTSLGRRR